MEHDMRIELLLKMNIELLKVNVKLSKACILHSWPKAACRADLSANNATANCAPPRRGCAKIELSKIEPMSENMKLKFENIWVRDSLVRLRTTAWPLHAHMLAISAGSWHLVFAACHSFFDAK